MKARLLKLMPILITAVVIGLTCLCAVLPGDLPLLGVFQRLEWTSYDWRMRAAQYSEQAVAPNLGAVFIDDDGIRFYNTNETYGYTYPWPRHLHGRVVEELAGRGVKAVGFDILFSERRKRSADTDVKLGDGQVTGSDEFFAAQLHAASNVYLAVMGEQFNADWYPLPPADLFRTNTAGLGHIVSEADADGVLRRAIPFKDDPQLGRVWNLGVILAAQDLGLDLDKSVVKESRLILRGNDGTERVIPLDEDGRFLINWTLAWNDPRLTKDSFATVAEGQTEADWQDKIVVVGSIGSGNNISDLGATPLGKSYLVSKHWNVANAIIMNQPIAPISNEMTLVLIVLLGALSALFTWKQRALRGTLLVVLAVLVYLGYCLWAFISTQIYLPVVLPVGGALLMTHVGLVTHRVMFEEREKRRIKSVFKKIVSPNVVNELLDSDNFSLGSSRRVTVFFADVRGFTEMTDLIQTRAEEYVAQAGLTGKAATAHFEQVATETLATVNLYLATIADVVKKHNGTLDKYIGDCVMAFWGAPTPNPQHAVGAVRAAVEAQQAIAALNVLRTAENEKRAAANLGRPVGTPPLDPLPVLSLGSGINTGTVIVGLMGSDAHILNYTVFGREVNLASRLEGVSGRGRIVIGEATFRDLQEFDPALARQCKELEPVHVKGFRQDVKVYEVPWKG